jgi:hypothetical protein
MSDAQAGNEQLEAAYPEIDIETAYENAGGDTWDDLLQYLESDPAEDFDGLSKNDLRRMTARVRELIDEGRPYPASADELRELLAAEDQAMVNSSRAAEKLRRPALLVPRGSSPDRLREEPRFLSARCTLPLLLTLCAEMHTIRMMRTEDIGGESMKLECPNCGSALSLSLMLDPADRALDRELIADEPKVRVYEFHIGGERLDLSAADVVTAAKDVQGVVRQVYVEIKSGDGDRRHLPAKELLHRALSKKYGPHVVKNESFTTSVAERVLRNLGFEVRRRR